MPVNITNISIYSDYKPEPVNWLLANIGDKLRIEIDLEVSTFNVSASKYPFILNAKDGYIGDGWIYDRRGGFKDFRVNDTIRFYDRNTLSFQNRTIIFKKDDQTIQLDSDLSGYSDDFQNGNCVLSVTTPISALRYQWNFIENNEQTNFINKISNTTNELVCKNIDASSMMLNQMLFINDITSQIGSAECRGDGIVINEVYTSKFKIYHYTELTPFILANQFEDLVNGIKPNYYRDSKCLKAIFDVKAAREFLDPNWIQSQQITEIFGNTGLFDENFNTNKTDYFLSGQSFKRLDNTLLSGVELTTNEQKFEFYINSIKPVFIDLQSQVELKFLKVPFDVSEYQGNNKNINQNFVNDRVLLTLGQLPINGEQFNVFGRQVLKSVKAQYVNPTQILVSGSIKLLDSTVDVFNQSEIPRYSFSASVFDVSKDYDKTDLTRLNVSLNDFFIDITDDNLVTFENTFLRHYEADPTQEGAVNIVSFPEDEEVAYSLFYIDKLGRENDVIKLLNSSYKIKAKNIVNGKEFTLDSFDLNLSQYQKINGNEFVDFEIDRVFNVPENEIRKKIKVNRRQDLDFNGKIAYEVYYPFFIRWEYWVQLMKNNNDSQDEFFDVLQPQNGFNQNWYRYQTFQDWKIFYEILVTTEKNGNQLSYSYENYIPIFDYFSNTKYDIKTIKAYDPNTMEELIDLDSGTKFLYGFKNTLIRAEFNATSNPPSLSKTVVNMGIEIYEQGGIEGKRRMSSRWQSDNNTWFKSIDLSDKTKVTLQGNTIQADVLVDFSKIPLDKSVFKITARLYDNSTQYVCLCYDGYEFDPTTNSCKKTIKSCPSGYVLAGDVCQKIYSVDATTNETQYQIYPAIKDASHGNSGARFYKDDNVTIDEEVNFVGSIWNNGPFQNMSRVNLAGVWTEFTFLPNYEWVGFATCLTNTEAKSYYLAIAGDNLYRFFINGVLIKETTANTDNFVFQNIYKINLNAGYNVLTVEAKNLDGPAVLYAEIFDNTLEELKTATNINDLNVFFSTFDRVGTFFDTGVSTGYSCPSGYFLDTCAIGGPVCSKILETGTIDVDVYQDCDYQIVKNGDYGNDYGDDYGNTSNANPNIGSFNNSFNNSFDI